MKVFHYCSKKHTATLTSIELTETTNYNRTLTEIGKLDKLFSLSLRGTKITDKGLKCLVNPREFLYWFLPQRNF